MWSHLSKTQNSDNAILASLGTIQVELQYLSDITHNPIYQTKALKVLDKLREMNKKMSDYIPGLYPKYINVHLGIFTSKSYGIGADADSFYEYLLKLALSTGMIEYRDMYLESVQAILTHLLQSSPYQSWFGEREDSTTITQTFHHLTCFTGGMLTLGAFEFRQGDWTRQADVGRRITDTCWNSYLSSKSGLGGEVVEVKDETLFFSEATVSLRPEVIESIFYQWR